MTFMAGGPHVLAFWILDPIYTAMGTVLAWFYAIVPSYGLSIALLTIAVRVLLIPLTTKQVKSQQAMQRIQPELKRLQAKYKDDRTKLNEEMMKFYKENEVNPVAGCLPLLLQTPLFIVLYRLILGLIHKPHPKHLPASSAMYKSLVQSGGKMVSWGIDLAQSASAQHGLGKALPFYALIAVTIASGFYQQRQMTARMPAGQTNAQMKMIGRVFPVMIGLISFRIPAGVVVYFVISNIWQIGQQELTFRKLGPVGPAAPPAKGAKDEVDGGTAKPKGFFAALREAAGGPAGPKPPPGKSSGKKPAVGRGGQAGKGGGAKPGQNKAGSNKPGQNKPGAARPGQNKPGQAKGGPQQPSKKQQPPPAKGKRPPPSPRPKGLPEIRPPQNGQKDPSAESTPPRKDV